MLTLRARIGGLYVAALDTASTIIRRLIPKETAFGRILARIKQSLRGTPVPRSSALLGALSRNRRVRFIQIGANDGILEDPLRPFIDKYQWQGILVEPLRPIFERLQQNYAFRDGLIFENVAISSQNGVRAFYHVAKQPNATADLPTWHTGLGSFSKDVILRHARDYPDIAHHLVESQVNCLTFESICDRHSVRDLDVLAIDAEGYDYEILSLIDFLKHRPLVVLYEHHHMTPDQIAVSRKRMAQHGYDFFEEILNTVCFRIESSDPRDRQLLPLWNELKAVDWIPI